MPNDERNLETIPDGLLGLIPLDSCRELGLKVDRYLVGWRERRQHLHQHDAAFKGYRRDSYIISPPFRDSEPGRRRALSWNPYADMTSI